MKIYKQPTDSWYLERLIYLIGGSFILIGSILGFKVNINFFYLPMVVSILMIIFSLTGYCPMAIILKAISIKEK